ncbi:hypothetical protein [Halosimplex amylolyticum]|uniref:hypothetical protein n=1 Tax=Halosimplex amylolyticum TaxID=3396616 RepID=UPI003F5584EE
MALPLALRPPAQSVGSDVAGTLLGIAILVLALVLPGLALAALWLPFTLSKRVRRLFEMGPTSHWLGNFVAGFVVVGAVHTALLFGTLTNAPTDDAVASIVMLGNPAFALVCWAVAAFALPLVGYDWVEDAVVSRLFLFLGAVWYAAVTTVPLFLAMVFYYLPT